MPLRLIIKLIWGSFFSVDAQLLAAHKDLLHVTSVMHAVLDETNSDTEDIPGYDALADEQKRLITILQSTPAMGMDGTIAKARSALLKPVERGYDGAVQISLSLCRDLVSLASTLDAD